MESQERGILCAQDIFHRCFIDKSTSLKKKILRWSKVSTNTLYLSKQCQDSCESFNLAWDMLDLDAFKVIRETYYISDHAANLARHKNRSNLFLRYTALLDICYASLKPNIKFLITEETELYKECIEGLKSIKSLELIKSLRIERLNLNIKILSPNHFDTYLNNLVLPDRIIEMRKLSDYLDSRYSLSIGSFIILVTNIFELLANLHNQDKVLKSIDPSQVLIDQNGTVKIENIDQNIDLANILPDSVFPTKQGNLVNTARILNDLLSVLKAEYQYLELSKFYKPIVHIENLFSRILANHCQFVDCYDAFVFLNKSQLELIEDSPVKQSYEFQSQPSNTILKKIFSSKFKWILNPMRSRGTKIMPLMIFGLVVMSIPSSWSAMLISSSQKPNPKIVDYSLGLTKPLSLAINNNMSSSKCPVYTRGFGNPFEVTRGFGVEYVYPLNSMPGQAMLDISSNGQRIALTTDKVRGFISLESLPNGNPFPPGTYDITLTIPKSVPVHKTVTLPSENSVVYIGKDNPIQPICAAQVGP